MREGTFGPSKSVPQPKRDFSESSLHLRVQRWSGRVDLSERYQESTVSRMSRHSYHRMGASSANLRMPLLNNHAELNNKIDRLQRTQQGNFDFKTKEEEERLAKLKKTTIPLMGAVALSNIMYTALHSFYPIYIE